MFHTTRLGEVRLATVVVCLSVAGVMLSIKPIQSANVLASHWKLDEGSGGSTIDSAANRSGTLRNGAAWIAGRTGAAVNMDGVDDYISLPALEVTGKTFTIVAWVRNSGFPTGVSQEFLAKATDPTEQGTYWMLGQTNSSGSNRLRFRIKAGGQTTTLTASEGNLPLNTWYHAAATYDGNRMRLYLNGVEVGSINKSGWLSRGSEVPVHIGRSPNGSNYLRGAIDDMRIYGSALTRWEIASLMASASSPEPVPNQAPTVSLTGPAEGATFAAGTTIPVSALASDPNGTITRVEFFRGSTSIGADTSSPYSVSWYNVEAGVYTLKAVAWDNAGASTTSAARTITVSTGAPNQPPSVSLTAPTVGQTFTAPATITLAATASDPNGTIAQVEFYQNNNLITTDTTSPYSFQWTNVIAGSYAIKAVARDNQGATTVSSTRDITVKPPNLPSTAVFVPSSNHTTAVVRYVFEVFPAGANTTVANPVATLDLGKPAITNGECRADVASVILALPPGGYVATVTAMGNGGSAQSAPSPQFTR